MSASENTIQQVTQDTAQLLQEASDRTTESVVAHTVKYHETYTAIDQFIDSFWNRLPYIGMALIAFTIFWLLSRLFKLFVRKVLSDRAYTKQNLVLVLNRVGSTAIIFFGFLIAMMIAVPSFTPGQLMSALGLSSVAIGFAFKDIFQNLLSGILILITEPFQIGDDIIVNGMEGTVEDIQIRATYLRSPDGRRILIPNATVYTNVVTVNTAYTRRRCEFVVGIGYEDDTKQAKALIEKILNDTPTILTTPAFSVNVTSLADFSVNLTVRWWVDTSNISTSTSISEIQEKVKEVFGQTGISIPYPVQEVKMYHAAGKNDLTSTK